jgi:hypothetical protein
MALTARMALQGRQVRSGPAASTAHLAWLAAKVRPARMALMGQTARRVRPVQQVRLV